MGDPVVQEVFDAIRRHGASDEHYAALMVALDETGDLRKAIAIADQYMLREHGSITTKSAKWDEQKHPRAKDGRFGVKAGEHKDSSGGNDDGKGREAVLAYLHEHDDADRPALVGVLGELGMRRGESNKLLDDMVDHGLIGGNEDGSGYYLESKGKVNRQVRSAVLDYLGENDSASFGELEEVIYEAAIDALDENGEDADISKDDVPIQGIIDDMVEHGKISRNDDGDYIHAGKETARKAERAGRAGILSQFDGDEPVSLDQLTYALSDALADAGIEDTEYTTTLIDDMVKSGELVLNDDGDYLLPKKKSTGSITTKAAKKGAHREWTPEDEKKHPRAEDGRFGHKTGEQGEADDAKPAKKKPARAAKASERPTVESMVSRVRGMLGKTAEAGDVESLAADLVKMTVGDLTKLKTELGSSLKGKVKQDHVDHIVDIAEGKQQEQPPAKAKKEKAPAKEKPVAEKKPAPAKAKKEKPSLDDTRKLLENPTPEGVQELATRLTSHTVDQLKTLLRESQGWLVSGTKQKLVERLINKVKSKVAVGSHEDDFPTGEELVAGKPGRLGNTDGNVSDMRTFTVRGKEYVMKDTQADNGDLAEEEASRLAGLVGHNVPKAKRVKIDPSVLGNDIVASGKVVAIERVAGVNIDDHATLNEKQRQFMREDALFRYLTGNPDNNNGNYIVSPTGDIASIDHENSFETSDHVNVHEFMMYPGSSFTVPVYATDKIPTGFLKNLLQHGDEFVAAARMVSGEECARRTAERLANLKTLLSVKNATFADLAAAAGQPIHDGVDLKFTGTDKVGRKWVNGKLAKKETPKQVTSKTPKQPETQKKQEPVLDKDSYKKPTAKFNPADHYHDFLRTVRRVGGKYNSAKIVDLRKELSHLTREQQDALIAHARKDRSVSASYLEGRGGVSKEEDEASIKEDVGRLGYLSLRPEWGNIPDDPKDGKK